MGTHKRKYRMDICEMRRSYGLSCHNCYHFDICRKPEKKVPWEDNVNKTKGAQKNDKTNGRNYVRHHKLSNRILGGKGGE